LPKSCVFNNRIPYIGPMKVVLTLGCFFYFIVGGVAQFNFGASNANTVALGGAETTHQYVFTAIDNPAGLVGLSNLTFGISSKNSYLIEGLYGFTAAVGVPTKSGTFGVGLQYKGYEGYTALKANIAYGRKLLDNLSIGGAINVYNLSIANYGNTTVVNAQIGLQAQLNNQLLLGANISNPIKVSITADEQSILPTIISAGLRYQPATKTAVYVEGEKQLTEAAIFKAGLSYEIANNFELMVGATSGVDAFTAGLGWQMAALQIVFAGNYHTILGFSPTLSIIYASAKNKG